MPFQRAGARFTAQGASVAKQPPQPFDPSAPRSTPLAPIEVDLTGRTAVVSGATAGIGLEVAHGLAALGGTVVMLGRSAESALRGRQQLLERGVDPALLRTEHADLARLPQVRELGKRLAEAYPRVDALVNNAGCYPGELILTPEGLEESWATNVLSYEVLATALLPSLTAAGGRIVDVASTLAGHLDTDDLLWARRPWRGQRAYQQSKQANRMLAWAWDRRLRGTGVTINVAHPDGTATNIAHRQKGLFGLAARLAFRTQRPPAEGADTVLWLAAAPELAGHSGGFYWRRQTIECGWQGDVEGCDRLWELTRQQIA
jgi:NAD(P)-dependent dehydrogenase (short-subunit alcohol dehydrogenase family)